MRKNILILIIGMIFLVSLNIVLGECYNEGESFNLLSVPDASCCSGLTQISVASGEYPNCASPSCPCYICTKCGDGFCDPKYEGLCNCPKDCNATCANNGEKVYISANVGPANCCSKNAGIRPSSSLIDGTCAAIPDLSLGVCIDNWWYTCGDKVCDPKNENKCNCPRDCTVLVVDINNDKKISKNEVLNAIIKYTSRQISDKKIILEAIRLYISCGNNKCDANENCQLCLQDCCNDNNPCTTDSCVDNACVYTNITGCCLNDSECNDKNNCTIDSCSQGKCQFTQKCNDNNPCTGDSCIQGLCYYTSPAYCNDYDDCTNDTCVNGTCKYIVTKNCDDNDNCTIDTCKYNQCWHELKTCYDSNKCTDDACVNGTCRNNQINCDDNDPCTSDYCTPETGCMHNYGMCDTSQCHSDYDCEDNDACTRDYCSGGICFHDQIPNCGMPQPSCYSDLDCDDNDSCTNDYCINWNCVHEAMQTAECVI